MIKHSFLKAQTAKSIAQKRTAPFIRKLIFSVVDRVAREHYRADYSMKCLQTSVANLKLLARFGIRGHLCHGALCAANVFEDERFDGWGGFWDNDHHIWAVTQFDEIVDLSVSQTHLHPRSGRIDGIGMPSIWWDDARSGMPIFRYLPEMYFTNPGFEIAEDTADLKRFESGVKTAFERALASERAEQVTFGPILENLDGANALHARGNPWLNRAIRFQTLRIPFPAWIVNREAQLVETKARKVRGTASPIVPTSED